MKKVTRTNIEPNPKKELDKMIHVSSELFSRDIMGITDLEGSVKCYDNAIEHFRRRCR